VVCAQSALPATGPTVLPVATPQTSATTAPPAADAARRAQVVYSGGQLEITADNSSLNQILREICRVTGMKVTGGVTDERVFGKYGPGAPAEILVRLLDGTGSNMLLRETASKVPAELILTARQGGPTPPNPNARGFDDDAQANQDQAQQPVPNQPAPPMMPPYARGGAGAAGNPQAGTAPAPAADGANPTSPNGVQTPQQIFEQLQRMQQQQQAPPTHP
jgi:hypothetical protein